MLFRSIVYRFGSADVKAIVCTAEGDISEHVDEAAGIYGKLAAKVMVKGHKAGWLSFEDGLEAQPPFVRPDESQLPVTTDPMLLYFTSGTTGMPKMVIHDYLYPLGHIPTAKYWHKVDPDGLHLTVYETGWAKSVWGKLYGQWLMEAGIDVFDFDRFVPQVMLKHIVDEIGRAHV